MTEALQTGLYLTVAGMGLVFLVLAMLWGLLVLLLRFDQKPLPPLSSDVANDASFDNGGRVRTEVVAAITMAVHAYEADKMRRAKNTSFDVANEGVDSWLLTGRAQQQRDWQPRRWS